MDLIFGDDAAQKNPSRKSMGPLIAIGGLHVSGQAAGALERAVEEHCQTVGFPRDEQFKWSPGKKEVFQKESLRGEARTAFFVHLLDLARQQGATATVVVADTTAAAMNRGMSPELDVTTVFLERCSRTLLGARAEGLVIIAKPSGGSGDEAKFVSHCVTTVQEGTPYVKMDPIPFGVVTAPSRHMRLLQLADVITSSVVARIGGESNFSPPVLRRFDRSSVRLMDELAVSV